MLKLNNSQSGFTLVELVIGLTVLSIVVLSFFGLFTSLVNSAVVAKQKAVANSLASNQIEYLKSLPYDNLAVSGGSIIAPSYIPASRTQKIDGANYTIITSINYIDDAFDGCLVLALCRNKPVPASITLPDNNPADYKIAHVDVKSRSGTVLAAMDTQISSKVAETSSSTGALVVTVVDDKGNPISGANVNVFNNTITPNTNANDTSDSNGVAIFYNLKPDSNAFDYKLTASKNGFSTLVTIVPSGSLTPTFSSQKILSQKPSMLTMVIKPMTSNSLIAEALDKSGSPLANLKLYAKGGYKKYSDPKNTEYYFDNFTPTDSRTSTNATGLAAFNDLVPGPYYFCGDNQNLNCKIGTTTYYLVAAIPYAGISSYSPVNVPTYDSTSPPSPLFNYSSQDYIQKVRLIFSNSSSAVRIFAFTPQELSLGSTNLSSFSFRVEGINICSNAPCSNASANIKQGANTFTTTCNGARANPPTVINDKLDCTANMTGAVIGSTQLTISNGSDSYVSPSDLSLGSINVVP